MRPFIPLSASSHLPIASLSLRLSPAERKRGHRFPTSERKEEKKLGEEKKEQGSHYGADEGVLKTTRVGLRLPRTRRRERVG